MADRRTGKRVKVERTTVTNTKTLDELFPTFYEAKVAQGMTKRTLETYRENFRFLCDYLEMKFIPHEISTITPEVLRSYQTWMLTEKTRFDGHQWKSEKEKTVGLSPVTVNTRTKNLRTMFRFLLEEGLIDKDPWVTVKKAEESHTEINVLTVDQLKLLLQSPDQRTYAGFRDYVIMNLLIDVF